MAKLKIMTAASIALAMGLSGCVTDPVTGNQRISRQAIGGVLGAGAGYLLGDLIGGKNSRTEEIIGAGVGAVAGVAVGTYMENQRKKLAEQTAGTGVQVTEGNNDEILLNMPGDVTFALNSAAISPQFQSTLDQVAQTLVQYPSTYIDIYGHASTDGAAGANMTLSQQRARSVANYLSARGVQSARLATQGFGETQPKCFPENTEADRRCNRRVEIRLVPIRDSDVNAVS